MNTTKFLVIIATSLFFITPVFAAANTGNVELLYVQNSQDVGIEGKTLTLKNVGATTIYFSDRPKRIAGHMATTDFVAEWGKGENSFASNPPNADISIFTEDEIIDIVITLMNPRIIGKDLLYDIDILLEDERPVSGQCTVFIDPIGRPASPTSVAGAHRRQRHRVVRHEIIH